MASRKVAAEVAEEVTPNVGAQEVFNALNEGTQAHIAHHLRAVCGPDGGLLADALTAGAVGKETD